MNTTTPCDYNHLLLYAKHWYKRGDVLEDVRTIFAKRAGIDREFISNPDVWHQLVHVAFKYLPPQELEDLFTRTFSSLLRFEGTTTVFEMIPKVLSKLAILPVYGKNDELILNIGDPTPNILPLSYSAEIHLDVASKTTS